MKKTLTGILLMASQLASAQQLMFSDEFVGTLLNPGWLSVIPNPDGSTDVNGNGELVLSASPLNGGSDLWSGSNWNGTRILQPVCGNWIVQTKFHVGMMNNWSAASASLYAVDSASANVTLEQTGYRRHGIADCNGSSHSYWLVDTMLCLSPADTVLWLEIVRQDSTITESVSFDSLNWIHRSKAETRDIRYLGAFSVRMPYDGQLGAYTRSYLEYFRFVDMDTLNVTSSSGDMVEFGSGTVLSVDTVQSGSYAWYGPSGALLGDGIELVIDSATIMDAGWYHVMVSRLDCQFLTDSFLLDVSTAVAGHPGSRLGVAIYPNPAHATVRVKLTELAGIIGPISVVNALGQMTPLIAGSAAPPAYGDQLLTLDVSGLPEGAYFVVVPTEMGNLHGRFIKE